MQKLSSILVEKRLLFFSVSIIFAVIFTFFIGSVNINKDDTKYLDKNSGMSQGLQIIEKEFPIVELKDSFQIVFEGLTQSAKLEVYEDLENFDGVLSVTYDPESSEYNSKTYTMYIVETKYVKDSDKVNSVINDMKAKYQDQYFIETYYSGGYMDVLDLLIPMAVCIMLVLLFLLCKSYIEPLLILVSIAVAILINMGSNIIFDSVSEMTFSIAAVFQLVLSIDYSIMLIHRYVQEYEKLEIKDKIVAMKNAIQISFISIISSSITTIVGLLVLLMMSFTIGADIGLVLSKGVFLSLVCVFTVMPTMVLWSHNALFKLDKRYLAERRASLGGMENV